ncbi:hypothetical protein MWU49_12905 [Alcanivorax sp. S6407]|uniref:hypothetical protein n=1 Tax=Alcanivorax sp. S6407 TaxID=2926424 RepID=UPI001FF5FD8F|nr:hypothetical protein [Alcanivorax sp. S6407]MCK0154611.1 hypothetical protein [Alcanivorax sp. S6407]
MIELNADQLIFRFPEVHPEAVCRVNFQRTLRIPDDNRAYALPPGLGRFPVQHVEDHAEALPTEYLKRGGVMLPMYQAEAMWISFAGAGDYPFLLKIAAGKINAVTGEPWADAVSANPQDYVVVPDQPWLDGFCIQKGLIRQFVAMPLGAGYTAEEQLTGAAEFGGLQIIAYPMKRERYEAIKAQRESRVARSMSLDAFMCEEDAMPASMGLAPGGLMKQEIHQDPYGIDAWDLANSSRCFVHLLNSQDWQQVTGTQPPGEAPTAWDYTAAGLPWFDYYAEGKDALEGAGPLAGLDSVAAKGIKQGETPLPDNDPVTPSHVIKLGTGKPPVSEGDW